MKNIFLFISILITISCRSQLINNIDIYDKSWSISNMDGILCNECPVIEFKEGGRGKMINSLEDVLEFEYTILSEDKIMIVFDKKTFFESGEFIFKIKSENNLEEIELKSINNDSKYILTSEIKVTKIK